MINPFRLRAKWTRKSRKFVPPAEKQALRQRPDDTPVQLMQYFLAASHLADCWQGKKERELDWFLASMRGELPVPEKPVRNYVIHHVHVPQDRYLLALEAITTRLGVKV